jgi:hypothetical protein
VFNLTFVFQSSTTDDIRNVITSTGSAIGFQDLSPSLQQEITELQKRMAVELQPLVLESTLTMQKILEAKDHSERLVLVRHFIIAETKRLRTKKALKGMFTGTSTTTLSTKFESTTTASSSSGDIPLEEQILSSDDLPSSQRINKDQKESSSNTPSSFFADDDAFQ